MKKPPFYFATLPFALGILLQREWSVVVAIILVVFVVVNRAKLMPVVVFSVLGFIAGLVTEHENRIEFDQPQRMVVRVESAPTRTGDSRWNGMQAQVVAVADSMEGWRGLRGHGAMLSVDTAVDVRQGAMLHLEGVRLRRFDSVFAPYYHNRGIVGRVYAWDGAVSDVSGGNYDLTVGERLKNYTQGLADRIDKLESVSPDARALMKALTIGQRAGMDRDMRAAYSRSGAAHLLAVSGLHVGIVFMILGFLLGWIKLLPKGRIWFAVAVISMLWGYAALTGFSPSVLRAVVMFSIFQAGVIFARTPDGLNTLLAAGFILLAANPNMLMDIGFQLSFVAMGGIVLIYPLWSGVHRSALWRLVAVTLAAQVAVLPLSCYYFGMVPLLGVVVSLLLWLVVPTIIVLTFGFLLTGFEALGRLAGEVARAQNAMVEWCAGHSWAAVEGVVLPTWALFAIYGAMITIVIVVYKRRGRGVALNHH